MVMMRNTVIKNSPPKVQPPTEEELRDMIEPPSIEQIVSPYYRWKHAPERVVAALLLIPAIPIMLIAMLGICISSPGWPLFCQIRVGKNGRYFRIYKLRTMRPNAEADTGPVFATKNDKRKTLVGKILRKLHIDELPQLFNVLSGHMSLIGPRPERPEFVAVLAKGIPHYANRLLVLPGITGLAAINLPPDDGLESARRKQELDELYIRTASFWLDVRMLLCTSLRMFGLSGERTVRLTGVKRTVSQGAAPATSAPRVATPNSVLQEVETSEPRKETPTVKRDASMEDTLRIADTTEFPVEEVAQRQREEASR